MSDVPNDTAPTVAAFNASDLASINPEQRVAFADVLVRNGHSKEAVEKALTVPAAKPAQPAPSGPPKTPDGSIPERLGVDYLDPVTGLPSNVVKASPAVSDALAPPATSEGYRLDWSVARDFATTPIEQAVALNAEIRDGFFAAEIPEKMAPGLFELMVRTSDRLHGQSEAALKLHAQEVRATINKSTGGRFDETIKAANARLAKMDPALVTRLVRSDALADAQVILALAKVNEIAEARAKARAKP